MDKELILQTFKEEGIDIGEEVAINAVRAIFKLLRIMLPKISNGLGALAVPLANYAEEMIVQQLDKIDGEDDI